ncbi:HCP-like protein [Exidia glandulosa HHB12029]|uniref:HCP-like protein n=1 Tax=Exidia glandulosa HHB12029 TaxID=1314781 RepID=A0A165LB03_EXIGL|nr:HCP-like protein [Exidia glandulosa HHB12029]
MAAPPIPPRPMQYAAHHDDNTGAPPPVPPLPPNFAYDPVFDAPHWEDPIVAPRPFRYDPGLPQDMAQQLESRIASPAFPDPYASGGVGAFRSLPTPVPPHAQSYAPPPHNFLQSPPPPPPSQYLTPQPPPNAGYQPGGFHLPQPYQPGHQQRASLTGQMASMSLSPPDVPRAPPTPALPTASQFAAPPVPAPSSFAPAPANKGDGVPVLEMPRPTVQSLTDKIPGLGAAVDVKVAWAKEVLSLVERTHASTPQKGSTIVDGALNRLVETAIRDILEAAAGPDPDAQALYLRGTLASSGSFPSFVARNPKEAFRDFDASARKGAVAAWFNIARDYEAVGDLERAKQSLERGARLNVESCYYRLGMAHLLGQLGFALDPAAALPLLHRAAQLASADVPQPAYVFALILMGEFASYTAPPEALAPYVPRGSTSLVEARRWLERAAYLGSGAAQFKLGHAYEFGVAPFAPDPLLSVQYYSLAAQRGHPEADMALSKWFLCGSEGAFDKDEALARVFAEKSAMRGEREGEFAMGYYCEVGIGTPNHTKDLEAARKWYTLAADKGSAEARKRLDALTAAQPVALGRTEHEMLKESTLVRRRTQARDEAWSAGRKAQAMPPSGSMPKIAEELRATHVQPPAPHAGGPGAKIESVAPLQPQRRPQQQHPQQPQQRYSLSDPGAAAALGPSSMTIVHQHAAATSSTSSPVPQQQHHGGRVRVPIRLDDPAPQAVRVPSPVSAVQGPQHIQQQQPGPVQPTLAGATAGPGPGKIKLDTPGPSPLSPLNRPGAGTNSPKPSPRPGQNSGSASAGGPPKKGPATFQEMGFQSQKLDERECVIM